MVGSRRSRFLWSDEEKRRIVAEAVLPGASVADIARRHGVNASLMFNWRMTARAALSAAEPNGLAACLQANASSSAAEHCEFMPIDGIGLAEDEEPALVAAPSSAVVGGASSRRETLPRPGMDVMSRRAIISKGLTVREAAYWLKVGKTALYAAQRA